MNDNNSLNQTPNDVSQTNGTNFMAQPTNNPQVINPLPQMENSVPLTNNNIAPNNTISNMVINEDEELLKAYIGKNYEKITTKQFNLPALFLSSLYLFYRKMFLYGFLAFFLTIVLGIFVRIPAIGLLINIILGFFFNKLYVSTAKQRITAIKKKNVDKDINNLKEICTKKGGTSIGLVFLGLLINTLIMVGVSIILFLAGFGAIMGIDFLDIIKETKTLDDTDNTTEIEENTENIYNGVLFHNTNIEINNYFTIIDEIPEKFENLSSDFDYNYMFVSSEDDLNACKFSIYSPKGFSNSNELIDQIYNANRDNSPSYTETSLINNISWYGFSYEDSTGTIYYYGADIDSVTFLLEYEININADSDCADYREQVMNAIDVK